ncbi:MAG: hypothetical protein ACK56F_24365, partial [bacterium]
MPPPSPPGPGPGKGSEVARRADLGSADQGDGTSLKGVEELLGFLPGADLTHLVQSGLQQLEIGPIALQA